jgi:hypothetical protein
MAESFFAAITKPVGAQASHGPSFFFLPPGRH